MTSPLPHLDPITQLSPRVIRILGGNPSKFTLQGTNTHLVGTGPRRILIDTGEGKPIWKESLRQVLQEQNCRLEAVILTHWHGDHTGGIADVRALASELHQQRDLKIYKFDPEESQLALQNHQTFSLEGATLQVLHTPGHTTDHISLMLAEECALFTGDNVLGHGTAVFEDLATYISSLHLMLSSYPAAATATAAPHAAYPSHGARIADGPAKIREYIAHRAQREREAVEVLRGKSPGSGDAWWAAREMVAVIYRDYPEGLWGPAEGSLRAVLGKLRGEGRVVEREEGDGKWALVRKEEDGDGSRAAL